MPPPPPPAPSPVNGRAKSLIFNNLREWVVDNHGEEAWRKALARALPALSALSENPGTMRHVRCRYQGLARCEFEARWSK